MLLPVRVRSLSSYHVDGVRCGGSHTVVIVRPRSSADNVAADAKAVPDDDDDDDDGRVRATSDAQGKHSDLDKREFADKTIATGGFGQSKAVNSRDDAKTQLRRDAKVDAAAKAQGQVHDKEGPGDGLSNSSSSSSSSAGGTAASTRGGAAAAAAASTVAQTLATYDTPELTAQCISWARHSRLAEIEYALTRGADINVRDASGNTMLIVAAQNGLRDVLQLLVDRGADINVTNAKGNSALHYLFAYGFQSEADLLISKGADDYAQNLEGYTCYEMGLID